MARATTAFVLETAPPSVITVNRRSTTSHNRLYTIVEECLLGFVLDTLPPSVITVNRRSSNSQKRLDTIVEESLLGQLLEADHVTSSFSAMSLGGQQKRWGNSTGTGQSHSSYQRHGSSYIICAQ